MNWEDDLRWVTEPSEELARLERELERAKDPLREARAVQEALANADRFQRDLREASQIKSAADVAGEWDEARRMPPMGEVLKDLEEQQCRSLMSAQDLLREMDDARRDMAELHRLSDALVDVREVLSDAERVRALSSARGLPDARTVDKIGRLLPRLIDVAPAALARDSYDRVLADATRLAASADVRSLVERIEDPTALIEEALRYAHPEAPPLAEGDAAKIELYGVSSEQLVALVLKPHPDLAKVALVLYLALMAASSDPNLADQAEPIKTALSDIINLIALLAASKLFGGAGHQDAVGEDDAKGGRA